MSVHMNDRVLCTRCLTSEEIDKIDFDTYSKEEIHHLIDNGSITWEDVVHYYRNEQWDEVP